MKYDKLVRDNIPQIIKKEGKQFSIHLADNDEYFSKLKGKLSEELKEFIESESKEELADILEVLEAIYDFKNYTKEEIEKIKKEKAQIKGKFKSRIILEDITTILK